MTALTQPWSMNLRPEAVKVVGILDYVVLLVQDGPILTIQKSSLAKKLGPDQNDREWGSG